MSRGPDLKNREVWRRRMGRFNTLRETVGEFCQREQVSLDSYYQWKQKVGRWKSY